MNNETKFAIFNCRASTNPWNVMCILYSLGYIQMHIYKFWLQITSCFSDLILLLQLTQIFNCTRDISKILFLLTKVSTSSNRKIHEPCKILSQHPTNLAQHDQTIAWMIDMIDLRKNVQLFSSIRQKVALDLWEYSAHSLL